MRGRGRPPGHARGFIMRIGRRTKNSHIYLYISLFLLLLFLSGYARLPYAEIDRKQFEDVAVGLGWRYHLPVFTVDSYCQIIKGQEVVEDVKLRNFDIAEDVINNFQSIERHQDTLIITVADIGKFKSRKTEFILQSKEQGFRRILIRE